MLPNIRNPRWVNQPPEPHLDRGLFLDRQQIIDSVNGMVAYYHDRCYQIGLILIRPISYANNPTSRSSGTDFTPGAYLAATSPIELSKEIQYAYKGIS